MREELGVRNIIVFEKEPSMMSRASYVNQARVHNGYHYPRSVLTAYRSAVNFPRFTAEYGPAVINNFNKYYAISKQLSKVNARQFEQFCLKIGVDIKSVGDEIESLFNRNLIDGVFKVKEYAFNSHILRDIILKRIAHYEDITIHSNEEVLKIESNNGSSIEMTTNRGTYEVDEVFNCSYSQINLLHRRSSLPLINLKHEIAEMCLVKLPDNLKDFSITVMDGPFFSLMPFPTRGLHTLSHVRYTPQLSWPDNEKTPIHMQDTHKFFAALIKTSTFKKMYADVVRFIPALKGMEYVDSIMEVKTVLVKSENDDSRPILFRPNHGMAHYTCIMGGKLDNIYDVFEELRGLYAGK